MTTRNRLVRGTSLLVTTMALALGAGCGSSSAKDSDGGSGGAGGGGGAGTGGGGGAGGQTINCGDPNLAFDPTAVIDDMEAADPAALRVGGRNGAWWAGGDPSSVGSQIVPDGDAPAEAIPGGRCGSQYALRVTGHGFSQWAVTSVSMKYGAAPDGGAQGLLPYDAHNYQGITFWARIGDTSGNQFRVGVGDKHTRPEGGICDPAPGASPDTACFDYPGVDLTLKTTWTQFKIPFAGLGQRDFGLKEDALDTTAIITIEFNMPTGQVFDFWLDDISFY